MDVYKLVIEIIPLVIILLILVDLMNLMSNYYSVKFMNSILDLQSNKKYRLDEIKGLYINDLNLNITIGEMSDYSIRKISTLLTKVKSNLLLNDTKTFSSSFFTKILFEKTLDLTREQKEDFINILLEIEKEIERESKLFGLNKREKDIFSKLLTYDNVKNDIYELKDILVSRYKELIEKEELNKRYTKYSIRVGIISFIYAVLISLPQIISLIK